MMRHRLTRRLITLPAVVLAAAIVLALTPLAVPVAVIHDLFGARPRRFQWTRVFLFGLGYVLCEVAAIIAEPVQGAGGIHPAPEGSWRGCSGCGSR